MESTQTQKEESRGKYWLLFLISLVVIVLLLLFITPWFWVALPFVLTFLVKAMGVV
jgi:hypothetical protein